MVIYGVPSVYQLTRKSKALICANQRQERIKIDQITHDVEVLDTAICFIKSLSLNPTDIKTEKQLHQEDGFGERAHHPDFIFTKYKKTYCVEVELSLKAKARLEKNIKSNFLEFDTQIWVVDERTPKLLCLLEEFKMSYSNIEIISVEEVKENGTLKFIN